MALIEARPISQKSMFFLPVLTAAKMLILSRFDGSGGLRFRGA
jgi:hypothetical protein